MPARGRLVTSVLALVAAATVALTAGGQLSGSAAAIQLQLADLLFGHADYRTAMGVYQRVSGSDDPAIRNKATAGTVRSALRIAEFRIAETNAAALRAASPADPEALTLWADSLWASGLFDDAEAAYGDAIALDPSSPRAKAGMARSLASRNQLQPALEAAESALAAAPQDPDVRHILGYVYERLGRYEEAAAQYSAFLDVLPAGDRGGEKEGYVRTEIGFLRSFKGKKPFEIIAPAGTRQHTVSFRLVDDKIVVSAKMNGEPVDVTIDTGAEHTVVTARTAKRLDLPFMGNTLSAGVGIIGLRGMQISRLNTIEVGSLKVKNVPCLVKSPSIDALLPSGELEGLSPLAMGLSVTVDYKARRLTLGEPDHGPSSGIEMPLRMHRLATIRGSVNGEPASFIVDTGGQVISLSATTAKSLFKPVDWRRIGLRVYGTSGLDPDAYLLPNVSLAFDTMTLPTQPVVVLNLRAPSVLLGYQIGGIIGHKFLSKYRVQFDMEKSVLRLKEM
jgi:Flp pilus assembly protein TadD